MVTLLRLFHHGNVSFQVFFLCESCRIDTCEHLVLFASAPVSTGDVHELECLADFLCVHEVRACTEVCELALFVEADDRIFRKILDELYFVRLILFFHEFDRLRSRKLEAL